MNNWGLLMLGVMSFLATGQVKPVADPWHTSASGSLSDDRWLPLPHEHRKKGVNSSSSGKYLLG